MTERLYRDDPYLLEFDARVLARREHDGRPAVVLDRTAFYAESGGQPWDTGALGEAAVLAVVDLGQDTIVHVVDRPLAKARRCTDAWTASGGATTASSITASTSSRGPS
jgi:alanyl-tRNA synthetase